MVVGRAKVQLWKGASSQVPLVWVGSLVAREQFLRFGLLSSEHSRVPTQPNDSSVFEYHLEASKKSGVGWSCQQEPKWLFLKPANLGDLDWNQHTTATTFGGQVLYICIFLYTTSQPVQNPCVIWNTRKKHFAHWLVVTSASNLTFHQKVLREAWPNQYVDELTHSCGSVPYFRSGEGKVDHTAIFDHSVIRWIPILLESQTKDVLEIHCDGAFHPCLDVSELCPVCSLNELNECTHDHAF